MNHEQELGNLLARIHRDGGQYIQKHGWQKAIADADALIVGWIHAAAAPVQAAPDAWRKLALQFDGQRMQALAHLRAMLQDPAAHADVAKAFLAASPAAPQVPAVPNEDGDLPTRYEMLRSWLSEADISNNALKAHLRRVLEIADTWRPDYATKMDRDTLQHAKEAIGEASPSAAPQPAERVPLTADDLCEPKNGTAWRVEWWNENARLMLPADAKLVSFQSYRNGTLMFTIKKAAAGVKAPGNA